METLELRTAFYPCCGKDIRVPLQILRNFVDRVIFCDTSPKFYEYHNDTRLNLPRKYPSGRFVVGSARDVLKQLQRIDVLFYRCDSGGESGSNLKVLGNIFLQAVLDRMPLAGGKIITDGSNSRQSNFEKMTRPTGMNHKFGWHLEPYSPLPVIKPPDG